MRDAIKKRREGLNGEIIDTMHVWVTVYDDGRRKDHIHYRRGNDKVDALKRELNTPYESNVVNGHHIRDDLTLHYCGTFREWVENADQYEFDFIGHSDVPMELAHEVGFSTIHDAKDRASVGSGEE